VLQALTNAPDFTVSVGSTIVWDFTKHGANTVGTYTVDSNLVTNAREDVIVNIPTNTGAGQLQIEVTYV
jgi:hypothetical protein